MNRKNLEAFYAWKLRTRALVAVIVALRARIRRRLYRTVCIRHQIFARYVGVAAARARFRWQSTSSACLEMLVPTRIVNKRFDVIYIIFTFFNFNSLFCAYRNTRLDAGSPFSKRLASCDSWDFDFVSGNTSGWEDALVWRPVWCLLLGGGVVGNFTAGAWNKQWQINLETTPIFFFFLVLVTDAHFLSSRII